MKIAGFCPMGCGETLVLTPVGIVQCVKPGCLEPNAVTKILSDNEFEHVVEFTVDGFLTRHPLWERVHTKLSDCRFQEELALTLTGPPGPLGVYRATRSPNGDWQLTSTAKEAIYG